METAQLDRAPSADFNRFGKFCQEVKINKKTGCNLCNLSIDFLTIFCITSHVWVEAHFIYIVIWCVFFIIL